MRTYIITYNLKGYSSPRTKLIPSFSAEEAEDEFRWIMKVCYDHEPEIISIEEMPKNGCEKHEELSKA